MKLTETIRTLPYPYALADNDHFRRVWQLACDAAAREVEKASPSPVTLPDKEEAWLRNHLVEAEHSRLAYERHEPDGYFCWKCDSPVHVVDAAEFINGDDLCSECCCLAYRRLMVIAAYWLPVALPPKPVKGPTP